MKTLTVGKLKSNFSKVLLCVRKGEEFTVAFGKQREKVAVILPFKTHCPVKKKWGLLANKGSFKILPRFKMTDEEFLAS